MGNKTEYSFIDLISKELSKRNNPTDLKASIIGKVVSLDPLTVQISEGNILLVEGEELEISEWFRFRCNIDKDLILSNAVSQNIEAARNVTETHSYSGSSCNMPQAISYLADAILGVRDELLALKCDLQYGDYVVVSSLEETDRYIVLDKVL